MALQEDDPRDGMAWLSDHHPQLFKKIAAIKGNEDLLDHLLLDSAEVKKFIFYDQHDIDGISPSLRVGIFRVPYDICSFDWQDSGAAGVIVADLPGAGRVILARREDSPPGHYMIWDSPEDSLDVSKGYRVRGFLSDRLLPQIAEARAKKSSADAEKARKQKESHVTPRRSGRLQTFKNKRSKFISARSGLTPVKSAYDETLPLSPFNSASESSGDDARVGQDTGDIEVLVGRDDEQTSLQDKKLELLSIRPARRSQATQLLHSAAAEESAAIDVDGREGLDEQSIRACDVVQRDPVVPAAGNAASRSSLKAIVPNLSKRQVEPEKAASEDSDVMQETSTAEAVTVQQHSSQDAERCASTDLPFQSQFEKRKSNVNPNVSYYESRDPRKKRRVGPAIAQQAFQPSGVSINVQNTMNETADQISSKPDEQDTASTRLSKKSNQLNDSSEEGIILFYEPDVSKPESMLWSECNTSHDLFEHAPHSYGVRKQTKYRIILVARISKDSEMFRIVEGSNDRFLKLRARVVQVKKERAAQADSPLIIHVHKEGDL